MFRLRFVAVLAAASAACSPATFVSSWKAPLDGPLEFDRKRVAAVVVSADESVRRGGEDALARQISKGGAQGIASYTILSSQALQSAEAGRRALSEANVIGAVVMRVVPSEAGPGPEHPGLDSGSLWRYWGHAWPAVHDPGYLRNDTAVLVETLVYSVPEDKLVWAGHSKTTNPSDVLKLIRELANGARKELEKAGFLSS